MITTKPAMPTTLPFSITPDAADYIRSRLDLLLPAEEPALFLTMSQTDGEKRPRWSYEGESFIIGSFEDPSERPPSDYFDLFGRRVAVEHNALKRLAGRVLALRRVDARYGWLKNTRHVLVAASESEATFAALEDPNYAKKWTRFFQLGILSVLSAFCGVGISWGIVVLLACILFNKRFDQIAAGSIPILVAGGILGFIAGYFFFRYVFKTKGRTLFAQEQIEERFFGFGAWAECGSWTIFLGIPTSFFVMLGFAYGLLARAVGQNAAPYVALGICLVILAACLIVSERIPRRLVLRLGFVGWMITILVACWYFGLTPKASGNRNW